jgi:arylsulfatase A-like enzyme
VADSLPVRLIDRLGEVGHRVETIDGTTRRILSPDQPRQAIPLDPLPSRPILRFSAGLQAEDTPVDIRFRASLELRDGSIKPVFDRQLGSPGWYDQRFDLGELDLAGAALVLQRDVVGRTSRRELMRGVWGEPMLLPAVPSQRASVVLISIDTLRADRVGAYGSPSDLTPSLDAFAQTGLLYEQAYSPSTWTLPSHFSMLHGLVPRAAPSRPADVPARLAEGTTSLASALREAGYLTAGFTGGGYVSHRFGFADGFDSYYAYSHAKRSPDGCSPDRFDGADVLRRTQEWLLQNGGRPFFLFVHTYDAHDRCPVRPKEQGRLSRWRNPGPEGRKRVSDYYGKVITKADTLFANLMRDLESIDSKQALIIAVTSDHGEALWEHGEFGHGCPSTPFEPLIRVPLIIRPSSPPDGRRRIATPVSVASIAPTLLALVDLPRPASMTMPPLPGLGLVGSEREGPIYVSCGKRLALRDGRYKLIGTGPVRLSYELYDLENDPAETENLSRKRPALVDRLHELALAYWGETPVEEKRPQGKERVLDKATRERIRALGYQE